MQTTTLNPVAHEVRPNAAKLTGNPDPAQNSAGGVDYTPYPEKSIPISANRKEIIRKICALYSGSASEEDMEVYAEKAIYDDPWSYCDTRYKIAGQWYGIPKVMASSKTLATEVVSSTENALVFKLRQEYTPRLLHISKPVDSLISLALIQDGPRERVVYHKDMWNEKDYSHEGLGKVMKTLNGDHLTKITQPPKDL